MQLLFRDYEGFLAIVRKACIKIRAPESIIGDYEYVCDRMFVRGGVFKGFFKRELKRLNLLSLCYFVWGDRSK